MNEVTRLLSAIDAGDPGAASSDGPGAVPAGPDGPFPGPTEGEGSADGHDRDLDFLQPSTRPGSLGRLGHWRRCRPPSGRRASNCGPTSLPC